MNLLHLFRIPRLLVIVLLAILGSCQATKPVVIPHTAPVPATFGKGTTTDTASIGTLPWRQFFNDPNLVALLDTAVRANPDLLIAVQRVEIASANVQVARGALLPIVDAGATGGFDRFANYAAQGQTSTNDGRQLPNGVPNFFVGLRSSWEIDIWGKLRNRKQAAFARLLASEQGRRLVETALVGQVARLYYDLLSLDNELDVLQKNDKLQERGLEIVRLQKLGGRATELAVLQFQAQLLRTRSLEAETRQRIVAAENQLNRLLGRYPQPIKRGAPLREQKLPEFVSAGLPATMLLRRPDVRQAELELVANRADVAAARAAFLPALTLSPYLGVNAYKPSLLLSTPGSLAYGLLAGLSAPLINRNFLKANYRQAAAEQRASYLRYQRTMQTGFEEVVTSLRGLDNYQKAYELRRQEVVSLNQAVAVSNDLYTASYANYLEVVTAQRSVLEAELNLTSIRREQFLLLIDLYRALGGGWTAAQVTE